MLADILAAPVMNGIFKTGEFYGRGVKLVNVYDLYQDTEINIPTLEQIEVSDDELARFKVYQGDVFFCRSSLKPEGVAWASYVASIDEPAVFECHLIRAIPDQTLIIPAFLSYYCRSSFARNYLLAKATVTTMATIDQPAIKALPILLPPLEIQYTLVSHLEDARTQRQQKLARADELLNGLDSYLLEQLGINMPAGDKRLVFGVKLGLCKKGRCDAIYYAPFFRQLSEDLAACSYPKVELGSIAPEIVGGATPKKGDADLYDDSGIKFLRILNIAPNEVRLDDVKYIKQAVHSGDLARSQLAADDVLMTITGRVGTTAVVDPSILPANINQHIVRLRIKSDNCLSAYLAAYLNSSVALAMSNRNVTGGTRIALDYEAIRRLQIPIPPLTMQGAISTEVERRRKEAHRLRTEAQAEWEAAMMLFERELLGEDG